MTTTRQPGKFGGCEDQDLGERLYECAGDSSFWDEDLGEAETFGWYALMLNPFEYPKGDERYYIVSEDSQGFFDYIEYETEKEAQADWAKLEKEYAEFTSKEDN